MKPAKRNSSIIMTFVEQQQKLQLDAMAQRLSDIEKKIGERRDQRAKNYPAKKEKGKKDAIAEGIKNAEKFKNMDDHKCELNELYEKLGTNPDKGLTSQKASELLAFFGENVLTEKKKTPWFVKLSKEMLNVFAIMLWVGAILCFIAYGLSPVDPSNLYLAIVLIVVVVISGLGAFYQNFKSEAIMEGFKNFIPPKSKVLRDGNWQSMVATKLVPGDIIEVKEGDRIPADFRVIQCVEMRVDNSSLTGESDPLLRSIECTHPENPLETKNICFFGTLCKQGTAKGVVLFTGDLTVIGQIASLASSAAPIATPLQREMDRFIGIIACIAISFGVVFFGIGFALGYDYLTNILFAIGLIVGNAPEGLLITLTVQLSLCAKALATKSVLAKNLQSVETLGSTTTICSDKTGTLTQNRMTVENLWYDLNIYKGLNKQKLDNGGFPGAKIEYDHTCEGFKILHQVAVTTSEAQFDIGLPQAKEDQIAAIKDPVRQQKVKEKIEKEWQEELSRKFWMDKPVIGDASETALVKFFQPIEDILVTRGKYKLVSVNNVPCKVAFNSTNKFALSIIHCDPEQNKGSHYCLLIKGAPERVWSYCTKIYIQGKEVPITKDINAKFDEANSYFGKNGQRVLGFAKIYLDPKKYNRVKDSNGNYKDYQFNTSIAATYPHYSEWNFELGNMTFAGLVSLIDPPRDVVPGSISKCKTAGIKVIMVTGDQPVTAAAIAKQVNILDMDCETNLDIQEKLKCSSEEAIMRAEAIVIHGDLITEATKEDELLPENQKGRRLDYWLSKKHIVFARTSPAQKLIIVKGCQARNEIVAVTGDGVNDSPAIKKADIGIAMGMTGSDVAKDAADLILLTDDFSALVLGIQEGRRFFDNLKKAVSYSIAINVSEVVPFIFLILFQCPLPVTTILLLLICVGTDMFPAFSFAYEEAELDIMIRKPRDRHEHLLSRKLLTYSYGLVGMFEAFGAMLGYFILMSDFGFPFHTVFGLAFITGYQSKDSDVYNPYDPYFGNTLLREQGACNGIDKLKSGDISTYTVDWVFSADIYKDLRQVYVKCEYNKNGVLTGGLTSSIDFGQCAFQQISSYTKKPICYSIESIKYAQMSYFCCMVLTQIACLMVNKTRRTSIFMASFRNFYQYWGLCAELIFCLIIAYIPFFNNIISTRDVDFLHFGVTALPFCLFILIFDEIRKYLINIDFRNHKEGEKPGWWVRNTCW